ncbi:MAG TPA: YezD family protein [Syntrophomonadaceae bacterium]|nr:YezD family protein [Syntrophomonadaceae bacterium]
MRPEKDVLKDKSLIRSCLDLDYLPALIEEIRFGSITIIIQDGKVIQIEKHEKIRLV